MRITYLVNSIALLLLSMQAILQGQQPFLIQQPFASQQPTWNPEQPLIASPEVRRLPPVDQYMAPSQWVTAPKIDDLTLEPGLKLSPAGSNEAVKPETIPTPLPFAPLSADRHPIYELRDPGEMLAYPYWGYDAMLGASTPVIILMDPEVMRSQKLEAKPIKLWEGSFQIGMNGSEGNDEAMNLRIGLDARRKRDLHLLTLYFEYNFKTTDSAITTNRLYAQTRYERMIRDTPWTLFWGATCQYDDLKTYDSRVTSHAGVGYSWFKTAESSFKSRFGAGFSHELDDPWNHSYAPEWIFGLEYERKVGERQRIVLSADYMPDMRDFQDYRLNAQAGWEIMLDAQSHLSLRFAVRNQYTSILNGTGKPNDLDYALLLLWKF